MKKNWYILQVISGKEKSTLENLSVLQRSYQEDSSKAHYISSIRVPEEEVVKISGGKKRVMKQKILPGYILIELACLDDISEAKKLYSDVVMTSGVGSFVGVRDRIPVPIDKTELEDIFERMGEVKSKSIGGAKFSVSFDFEVGESVQVIDGPFKGLSGKIELLDVEKRKIKVKIEIFGMPTPVELDALQVEKIY